MCGDRFIQGTALKQHQRMQGHLEGQQPSPYASISVNNPSRFTNSNLVNRRYMEQQAQQQSQGSPMPIKPVIPRRRTANNNNASNEINQVISAQHQQHHDSQQQNQMLQAVLNQETQDLLRSPSPSHHHNAVTTISNQDIKPNLQNLNLPQQFNGSGNVEIATFLTMSFNQNFPNHTSNQ